MGLGSPLPEAWPIRQGFILSTTANTQDQPAIAFDGTNHLVAWTDRRNGGADIFATRVNASGQALDPGGIAVSTAAGDQASPTIAFDGANYLVAWEDSRGDTSDIYGTRVTTGGAVVDTGGLGLGTTTGTERLPSISFDGTRYLVAWQVEPAAAAATDIAGTRVDTAGAILDPTPIAISNAADSQLAPAVAYDGSAFLVAWTDLRDPSYAQIRVTAVQGTGAVTDPDGVLIPGAAHPQDRVAIASDGTASLVVWSDVRFGAPDIYGARVQGGAVLDPSPILIAAAAGGQRAPSVAYNGSYLVAWRDERSRSSDIHANRVGKDGKTKDGTAGFIVAAGAGNEDNPAVARGPGDKWALSYQGTYIGGSDISAVTVSPK